jgi:hypothetical protein
MRAVGRQLEIRKPGTLEEILDRNFLRGQGSVCKDDKYGDEGRKP